MATIREEAVLETERPLISWGAIFAGRVFVVASTWLLILLGSAIGLSVAYVAGAAGVGQELGIGAVIWLLLTACVAYFLGSFVTARLAGKPERSAGMLHGVILWSVATVLMLVLGAWGIRGLFQEGGSVAGGAGSAAGGAGPARGGGGGDAGGRAGPPLVPRVQAGGA